MDYANDDDEATIAKYLLVVGNRLSSMPIFRAYFVESVE